MRIQIFIVLLLFFLTYSSLTSASDVKMDMANKSILINGETYKTDIISESLFTIYEETNSHFILTNEYLASSQSKTALYYIFEKDSLILKNVQMLTFKPLEKIYLGWLIKDVNIHINKVTGKILDKITDFSGLDYQIQKIGACQEITYFSKDWKTQKKYCDLQDDIYFDNNRSFYIPIYNLKKEYIATNKCLISKDIGIPSYNNLSCTTNKISFISYKEYLHVKPNQKTKMYLIKGDKVTILDEKIDDSGQKWYFINFKGTKDLNMWIKAEAVDIPESKDTSNQEKTEPELQTKVIKEPIVEQETNLVLEEEAPAPVAVKKKINRTSNI